MPILFFMKIVNLRIILVFLVSLFVVLGCDGVDTIIDGSEVLSDLTASERYQVCQEWADTVNAVVTEEVMCMSVGIGEAYFSQGDEAICQEVYEICMEDGGETFAGCDQDEINDDDLSGCNATVDDLRTCAEDWAAAWQEVVQGLSCSSDEEDAMQLPMPPSCAAFNDNECSDIIDASYPGDPGSD